MLTFSKEIFLVYIHEVHNIIYQILYNLKAVFMCLYFIYNHAISNYTPKLMIGVIRSSFYYIIAI